MKVLIVDDSSYYRNRGQEILEKLGYDIFFANDGYEAVKLYKQIKPDIVTMDICMPNIDGLEVTKQIYEYDNKAKILICSSVGHLQPYKKQAFKNGAVGILPKTYTKEEFLYLKEEIDLI